MVRGGAGDGEMALTGAWEYGFVTTSLELPKRRRGVVSPAEDIGTALAEFSGGLTDSLGTIDGGGWEAVSHQIVPVGGAMVVTVMIRRLVGAGDVS